MEPSYWVCTSSTKIQHQLLDVYHQHKNLTPLGSRFGGAVITLVWPYLQRDQESGGAGFQLKKKQIWRTIWKWARIQIIEDGCNFPNEVFIERARIEFVIPIWVEKSVQFLSSLEMEGNSERSKGLKNPLDLCVTHRGIKLTSLQENHLAHTCNF